MCYCQTSVNRSFLKSNSLFKRFLAIARVSASSFLNTSWSHPSLFKPGASFFSIETQHIRFTFWKPIDYFTQKQFHLQCLCQHFQILPHLFGLGMQIYICFIRTELSAVSLFLTICPVDLMPTVFQSYQDDGRMIMKGCVQWNPVYD